MTVEHSEELQDFLEHYGVMGMKWGVRKDRGSKSSSSSSKKSTASKPRQVSGASKSTQPAKKSAASKPSVDKANQKSSAPPKEKEEKKQKPKKEKPKSLDEMSVQELKELANKYKFQKEIQGYLEKPDKKSAKMRETINRIELERRYEELTRKPPSLRQKAKQEIGALVRDVARQQGRRVANHVIGSQLDVLLGMNGMVPPPAAKKAKAQSFLAKMSAKKDKAPSAPQAPQAPKQPKAPKPPRQPRQKKQRNTQPNWAPPKASDRRANTQFNWDTWQPPQAQYRVEQIPNINMTIEKRRKRLAIEGRKS